MIGMTYDIVLSQSSLPLSVLVNTKSVIQACFTFGTSPCMYTSNTPVCNTGLLLSELYYQKDQQLSQQMVLECS